MRKTERIFPMLLALVMILSLCACGGKPAAPPATQELPVEAAPAAAPETPAEATPQATAETPAEATPAVAPETPAPTPEPAAPAAPPAPPEPAALPIEGAYELFAVENMGALVYSADLEMFSSINLAAGGTGSMSYGEESMDITSWTLDGETMTITMADGGSAGASIHAGVIKLDINGTGEMYLYYAREGADTSAYAPMTIEEYNAKAAEAQAPNP